MIIRQPHGPDETKGFKNISYCPERVVQGKSIEELPKLPQIVSGYSKKSILVSKNLFKLGNQTLDVNISFLANP